MRWLARDTISLENQLRFGGVAPLEDVEGVSFRWVLVWVLVPVWVLGSPFELPAVCGNPPFGCVDGDVACGDVDGVGGSLSSGRGLNVDVRTNG